METLKFKNQDLTFYSFNYLKNLTTADNNNLQEFTQILNSWENAGINNFISNKHLMLLGDFILNESRNHGAKPYYVFQGGEMVGTCVITPNAPLYEYSYFKQYIDYCTKHGLSECNGSMPVKMAKNIYENSNKPSIMVDFLISSPEHAGKHFGRTITSIIINNPSAFDNHEEHDAIIGVVNSSNLASRKTITSLGFEPLIEDISKPNLLNTYYKPLNFEMVDTI